MSKPYTAEPRTITVAQAATVLGISRTTAYECVRAGSIPSLHLGGRIIVPMQAIEAMLERASRLPEIDDTSDEVASASARAL
ncbi:MAG TPA: helix-turn-helix domain-containing protein [Ilumatobacteraceae bacterium]|nr:helix-turn-helix domain-containing protein [Ilumatobacteraceae bacterium]